MGKDSRPVTWPVTLPQGSKLDQLAGEPTEESASSG